jgi:hypothetical protein
MLALHGADHEVGVGQTLGVAVGDRDIEPARLLAERVPRASLSSAGSMAIRGAGVVAGLAGRASRLRRQGRARWRTCLAEAEQGDDLGIDCHARKLSGRGRFAILALRAAWVSRDEAMRSFGRTTASSAAHGARRCRHRAACPPR